ncbi:tRNA (N6-isopentenyl adenosine(37)-C2)-methylthiotransferase MiaB [Candidatus Aerophobetes bacterium]|nr:tRNA (N6-isopentenyl adenosine(37)-C2)-methylthiotransferase MiaB [Candidatus Aerophobetes bacterium]
MVNLKAYIQTYGCQMNEYDSEIISGLFKERGYSLSSHPEEANLIILNTCYVRNKVKHKIYSKLGEIGKLKKKNPELLLGVCGCLAQKEAEEIVAQAPYIDFVVGTFNFHRLPQIVEKVQKNQQRIVEIDKEGIFPEGLPKLRKRKFSAYIPIMRGCNNFCTYCIVPFVRGRERSRLCEDILKEIEELSQEGYKEVILLGQNVNSYLSEGKDFADLLTEVNNVEGIERIRFTTSHPKDLSEKLIERMKLKKVCEHLHLPLQAGSNRVLQRMGRGYTRERYEEIVKKVREAIPEISLTTDLIVGFPGEKEEDFEETLEVIERIKFDGAFTFCYSPVKGTEAAEFEDQVPDEVKKERLRRLIKVQQRITEEKNELLVGQKLEVLVEKVSKKNPEELQGRTRTNKIVVFKGKKELIGTLIGVKIVASGCWALRGKIL